MLALLVASALFLRWMSYHGLFTLVPFLLCLVVALLIQASQYRRHQRAVGGVAQERFDAELVAVLVIACAVVLIGALGLAVVLLG